MFENEPFAYLSIGKNSKKIQSYFVIITDELLDDKNAKQLSDCLTNEHNKAYVLYIPYVMAVKGKQEEFFIEFMASITSETKLNDSKLYIISNVDHTALYREMINEGGHNYDSTYLNDIEAIYKYENLSSTCSLINK